MTSSKKNNYISCIKVNGLPILPPLIDEKRRKELLKDKASAVQIEHRLKQKREKRKQEPEEPLKDKNSNLTKDLIEVSEYNSESGLKVLGEQRESAILNQKDDFVNNIEEERLSVDEMGISLTPKPRLIRSNSYTLDFPSPLLLAYIEEQKTDYDEVTDLFSQTCKIDSYIPFKKTKFEDKTFKFDEKSQSIPNSFAFNQTFVPERKDNTLEVKKNMIPSVEVIQTDVTVQHITVNTNFDDSKEQDQKEIDWEETELQLSQVLKNLPPVYSNHIKDLIEKAKVEQAKKKQAGPELEEKEEKKADCVPQIWISSPGSDSVRNQSMSSQSIHFENTDTLSIDSFNVGRNSQVTSTPRATIYDDLERAVDISAWKEFGSGKKNSIRRELFGKDKDKAKSPKDPKEKWAASIITAHIKGYLTRRLIKTEKVQGLIETIKEAIICALELHKSTEINESDIELHRRLMQQISAACISFHEVFFNLSKREQMAIIAQDRERKKEKINRSRTSSSLKRTYSNSSNRSNKSNSSRSKVGIAPRKNLTKV